MTFYGVNVLFSLKQILSLILKHSRCTAVNKGRKSVSFHNSNALYQWSEAFAKTQSLFKYNSSLFSIIAILGDLPIALRRQYILFDGFTYNTRGYFASCVVVLRAPKGRGKIQAMSEMSASIICKTIEKEIYYFTTKRFCYFGFSVLVTVLKYTRH